MTRMARLGLFIVAGLMILMTGVFLIGRKQFLFSNTYELYAPFDNVGGLENGAAVRLGGVHVGTVSQIRMPEKTGGKVVVAMDLMSSTRSLIRKDSVASIDTEGLLGAKYVSISFGSSGAIPVQPKDAIQGRPPLEFSDLMKKSDEILDSAKASLTNVDAASGDLKIITARIREGDGTIGKLVNDKTVYENIRKSSESASKGAASFADNMEALKGNFFLRGFYRNRGYTDSSELGAHEIHSLPKKEVAQKFVYGAGDLFDKPTAAKLKSEKLLNSTGEYLQKNRYDMVVVAAFTGTRGEKPANLEISRAQAMNVRKYLVDHFQIDDSRVWTRGMGEDPNSTQASGRVEILVYQ